MPFSLDPHSFEPLIKIALAVVLSGILGFEREHRGRAAGLRTMILVCLGATLVMIVSERISDQYAGDAAVVRVDPGRVAAGIVTGIGFLGGGVILKLGSLIRGVTTAATIWYVAALGIAIGRGDYFLAIGTTVLVLMVLALLQFPEKMIQSHAYRTLEVTVTNEAAQSLVPRVREVIERDGGKLIDLRATEDTRSGTTDLKFELRTTQKFQALSVVREVAQLDGVLKVGWVLKGESL